MNTRTCPRCSGSQIATSTIGGRPAYECTQCHKVWYEQDDFRGSGLLDRWSAESKQFYSAGSAFSTLACGVIVLMVWSQLAKLWNPGQKDLCGLILSFVIVLAYALGLPEPSGYPNPGKFRLTIAEAIFTVFNTFIVFSTAVAIKNL